MADSNLPDRETIEERLQAVRERLWQACGIVGTARNAVNADQHCSDLYNALDAAYDMLAPLADRMDELLAPAEAQEVQA